MVTCTREPSMVNAFASSVCGFLLGMIQKRLPKCVVDAVALPTPPIMRFTDFLPRGCNVETLDTPKHFTLVRCHYRWVSTRFKLDIRRSSAGLRPEELRCRSTWTCRCPSYCVCSALNPVTSFRTSPMASVTSTPAIAFTGTLREYVIVLNLVFPPY